MVTDSRLVILCHNSGQEHFYPALNTGPWCLSELVCRQFRSTWMFLDGSPLKLNKHLTVTLLKCCYRNTILNVQIQMNHKLKFAHVSTLVLMIYGWRCQLRMIKATKAPGSRWHWLQAPQIPRRPAVWNWPSHVQPHPATEQSPTAVEKHPTWSLWKSGLLISCCCRIFHSPPGHTLSSRYTHILLLISNYFNI